jgi:hypothetical protein
MANCFEPIYGERPVWRASIWYCGLPAVPAGWSAGTGEPLAATAGDADGTAEAAAWAAGLAAAATPGEGDAPAAGDAAGEAPAAPAGELADEGVDGALVGAAGGTVTVIGCG